MAHAHRSTIAGFAAVLTLALTPASHAADSEPRELNVLLGGGHSMKNWHGVSDFASIHFEMLSRRPALTRRIANSQLVTSLTYSDVQQPRSWFGHKYGDPDDKVRAESLFVGARKYWRPENSVSYYAEVGTGPMWSNRRIPAATSRLNFDSQLGLGMRLQTPATPLYLVYRFCHISNGGLSKRNPGLQVHSFAIGTRLMRVR